MKFQVGDVVRLSGNPQIEDATVLAVGMVGDVEVLKLDRHTFYFDAAEYELVSRPSRWRMVSTGNDKGWADARMDDVAILARASYGFHQCAAKTSEEAEEMVRAAMAAAPGEWVEEQG